jgi:3-deoxy-D-manno-octulosonic-acid transferase
MNSPVAGMSERGAEAVIALWRGLGPVAALAAPFLLDRRTARGKEDPARRGERFGHADRPRPDGRLVWVHAASVGETVSALPLVARLVATGVGVLVTSGTVTSAALAAERLPAGAIHQYVPLDLSPFVRRFLDHWRPDLAVFVESEIWPVTVAELAERDIPQILVNARLSERSARRWGRVPGIARALFGRISVALAQSPADAERLAAIGVGDVRTFGNLKWDGAPLAVDGAEHARLSALIGDRPAWIAASTHPGEDELAAEVHARAVVDLPGLLTVIAPRHPVRGPEIRDMLVGRGLAVALRSAGEDPSAATDVLLADTLGEMGLVYRLAPVAFVGGTVTPKGGHNPIEPARLGTAILHGPSIHNAAEVYRALDEADAAVAIDGADDLARAVVDAHRDPEARDRRIARAAAVAAAATGILDRTLALIGERLEAIGRRR